MHDLDRFPREISDESYQYEQFEFEPEVSAGSFERPFSESELEELAMELLSVQDEQELDQFLGKFLGRVVKGAGQFLRTQGGKTLKKVIKNAAIAAVPGLGVALNLLPTPGIGQPAGAAIKGAVEGEGLFGSEAEIEATKKVLDVASAAAQQVAELPPNAPPQAVGEAVQSGMQQVGIPETTGGAPATSPDARPTGGEWRREGRSIIVTGL